MFAPRLVCLSFPLLLLLLALILMLLRLSVLCGLSLATLSQLLVAVRATLMAFFQKHLWQQQPLWSLTTRRYRVWVAALR